MSTAIFIAAVLTAAAAVLGPFYARAGAESTLRDVLTQAGPASSGLQLQATNKYYAALEQQLTLKEIQRSFAIAPAAGSIKGYPRKIDELSLNTSAAALPILGVQTDVVWRDGACAHLTFTVGRCPTSSGETAVSARTVAGGQYGWKLGRSLTLPTGQTLRIVGLYQPKNTRSTFWFGQNYFDAHPNPTGTDTVDSVFVTEATFNAVPASTLLRGSVDYPLDPSQIRLATVPTLRAAEASAQRRFQSAAYFTLTTSLGSVLDQASHQKKQIDLGAGVVTAQLTLLGWLVLFLVMSDAVEARGAEIALAKLRGLSPPAIWRFGLGEPLVILGIAMPLGFCLGYLGAVLFARIVLVPNTPVLVPWSAPAAVVAVFAGGFVAAIIAARRVVTRSVLSQWRRTAEASHQSRAVQTVEIAVSAVAVAGLVVLLLYPKASGLILLAPGLLVVAVALLGTRLIPLAARALIGPTRSTRRIGTFLASRQVARRPAGLRLAALLTVAVGLACFGVAGESVAAANRVGRADAETGASQVVSIQYSQSVDPIAAVRKADPDGTWAAAAATWLPDGGNSINGTVLAVDSSRLAAVGDDARGGLSTDSLAKAIGANTVPALTIMGTSLRATIASSGIDPASAPLVQFNLVTRDGAPLDAESTALSDGTHQYVDPVACGRGCTFVGVTWDRPITVPGTMKGTTTLTQLEAETSGSYHPVQARLSEKKAWRALTPQGQATDRVSIASTGVRDHFDSNNGGFGGIAYAYTPNPIPIVATPSALVTGTSPGSRTLVDGFGATAHIHVVTTTPVLPVVLNYGAIADLSAVRTQLPSFDSEATWQVWLSPSAPADAVHRLQKAGLTVQGQTTASSRVAVLGRQAPALSLLLLLIASFVGAILAMGATAVSIAAAARRRSYEFAALRAIQIPVRALFRSTALEQSMLLGGAVILGVPAGIIAAIIALPVLPEFATSTPVKLSFVPHPLPLVAFAVLFAVLVAGTALMAASRVLQQAQPSRLREGEE